METTKTQTPTWMTVTEASRYMRTNRQAVCRLIADGVLTAYTPVHERLFPGSHVANGGRRLLNVADLDAYLRSCPATPRVAA